MIQANLTKRLNTEAGVMNLEVELHIDDSEFVTLFGKSGAGKTTILRMLAGLTNPDRGRIEVDGEVWFDSDKRINLPPQKREIGFVFQDYALFPHMSVEENLQYAAAVKANPEVLKRINHIMEATSLYELRNQKPERLSGGQKQRVALARAIVRSPKLLLLDEPLSALDLEMRQHLQNILLKIHREFGLTTVMVSHDLAEVFRTSTNVLILEMGRIAAKGSPDEIFSSRGFSGKFRFYGEILSIRTEGIIDIITVLVGNQIVRVVSSPEETSRWQIGQSVMVATKALHPIILPINRQSSLPWKEYISG